MTDIDCGLITDNVVKLAVDLRFGDGVKGGCWLIQDDKGRVLIEGAGDGDFLRLTAGDLHTVLVQLLIKVRIQPFRHGC